MKKYLSIVSLFCAVCFAVSGVSAQEKNALVKTNSDVQMPDSAGYRLGAGDEIEIKVLGEPEFGGEFTVDEDGRIQLPFVDKPITASCRTERELRSEVTALLKKYLREPQVNVRVKEKRSRPPATVYGEVKAAQQFDMRRNVRLIELLSYTGGETEKANGLVEVTHTRPLQCEESGEIAQDDPTRIPTQVYRLSDIRAGKADANPIIRPGDIVNVLSSPPVYIIGEVRAPGKLIIPDRGLTLTDAVAQAYGLNERAKKKEIRIYRVKQNSPEREMLSFNLDLIKKGQQSNVLLQPFDIVEVEKAPKSIGQVILELATGSARTFTQLIPTTIIR